MHVFERNKSNAGTAFSKRSPHPEGCLVSGSISSGREVMGFGFHEEQFKDNAGTRAL